MDSGCIVDNVETIIAVYNAVKLGRPVTNRISTITGDAIANPGNFLYSIGTNYAELVDAAGGFKTQPEKIISGGPMMGFAMFGLDIPTTKTSSSLYCRPRMRYLRWSRLHVSTADAALRHVRSSLFRQDSRSSATTVLPRSLRSGTVLSA